jgi:hypothetical protein
MDNEGPAVTWRWAMTDAIATVVVISHERPALCSRAVGSVLASLRQAGLDLPVVVLDSSQVAQTVPPGVQLVHRPDEPSCVGKRRMAFEQGDTDWVIMLDDDCQVVPEGLGRLVAALGAPEHVDTGAVFVVTDFAGERTRMFEAAVHSDLTAGFNDEPETTDMAWSVTTLSAFRRRAILDADAFSKQRLPVMTGGEDVDACLRLRSAGWRLHRLPEVLALHDTQTWNSFRQNLRRSRNYGAAEAELVRLYPDHSRLGWENLLVSGVFAALAARAVGGRGTGGVRAAALVALLAWSAGEAAELHGRHPEATMSELAVQTAWSLGYEVGRLVTAGRRRQLDLTVRRFDWVNPEAAGFSARIGPGMAKRLLLTGIVAAGIGVILRATRSRR